MLLSITTTHRPATVHKSPFRVHSFEQVFGKAHVFYPDASANVWPQFCEVNTLVRKNQPRTRDQAFRRFDSDSRLQRNLRQLRIRTTDTVQKSTRTSRTNTIRQPVTSNSGKSIQLRRKKTVRQSPTLSASC